MQFKINKISTLNQKMKTSKTPGLSWQNKLISTALASISLVLGAPQLAIASLPVTTASNMQSGNTGTVTASTSGGVGALTITTSAQNGVINWQNFSDNTPNGGLLTSADSISFVNSTLTSPGSFAVLNNIQSAIPTVLGGTISSAGKIFFLNPAGIAIGSSTIINVGAFYASTVNDLIADPYFTQYGTLSIFNGVAPSTQSVSSGIIYIDSGATITTSSYVAPTATAAANGIVSLASGLQGAPTIKILDAAAAVATAPAQGSFNSTQLTINQGTTVATYTSANTATDAVQVAATTLSNIGAFSVSTLGGSVNLGGSITTVNTNPTNLIGVTATGGTVNIYSQGGGFKTGAITAGGAIVINTANTTNGSGGTIVNSGTVSSTGSITLSSATAGTTGAAIYSTGTNPYNASGILTANAGSGYLGLTGSFGGTTSTLVGAGVTVNSSAVGAQTISSITSTGAVTVSTVGNITLTTVTSVGALSVSTSAGNIVIPTINAQGSTGSLAINAPAGTTTLGAGSIVLAGTGASTVNSQGSASISNLTTTALPNSGLSLSVTTANGQPGTAITDKTTGSITLATSTINGNVLLSNNMGNTTITGPVNTNNLLVYTGNGTTSLTGAITFNGVIAITSNGNSGLAADSTGNKNDYISSTGSITNSNNTASITASATGIALPNGTTQTMGAGYNMIFTTNNGYVSLTNVSNPVGAAGGLFISTNNGSSSTSATTSYVSVVNTPALSVSGNVNVNTYGKGSSITLTGINLVSSNSAGGASATTGNRLIISEAGDNANITVTGSTTDIVATVAQDTNLGTYAANGVLTAAYTSNNLTNTVTISTTGNLSETSPLVAYGITLQATGAGSSLNTGNLNSTLNYKGSVSLQSGLDISLDDTTTAGTPAVPGTHAVGNYQGFGNITLVSSGNVSIGSTSLTQNMSSANLPGYVSTANSTNLTLQSGATTQNIAIGADITVNKLTLSGGIIADPFKITTNSLGATITGNSVSLTGANDFSLGSVALGTVAGASGSSVGITLNSAATAATNIIGASTADAGFLVITANGPINLGPTSTQAVTVTGNTSVKTYGGIASGGLIAGSTPITANYGSYGTTGNATFTANGNISIGTASNYVAVGTVNASGINYPVSIYANASGVNLGVITSNALTVATTGNITNTGGVVNASTGTLTAATTGSVTLGTTSPATSTLTVAQAANLSVTGTSGTITGNGLALTSLLLSGGTGYSQTGGSIVTANIAGAANTALNITNASVTTLNIANTGGTITSTLSNSPVSAITINSGAGNTVTTLSNGSVVNSIATTAVTGQTDLEVYNSTIGTLTMASTATSSTSTGGLITYNAFNSAITNPVTFTLNYGGLNAYASGTSTLNASNVYSLGNFNIASTINGNGSFTIANLTDTSNATGSLTVTANAQPVAGSTGYNTAVSGTGVLTLGTGINLSGINSTQTITFTTGNSSLGTVTDAQGASPFIYGATTSIIGRTISLGGAGDPNLNAAAVQFTSNGSVTFQESGSVSLAGLSLGTNATSASITSQLGAINQVGSGLIATSNAAVLTFTAQGTYATSGVVGSVNLSNANNIAPNTIAPNLGNTALKNGAGSVSIIASGNSVLNNTGAGTGGNINLGTVTVLNTGNNATLAVTVSSTANITQTSGSIFTWGNDLFQSSGAGNITLTNAGNNFGNITALTGTTGNVAIAETATSTYNKVVSNLFTASSTSGDIIASTNNVSLSTKGANLTATNGNINLTGYSSGTDFGNGTVTVTAPNGNVTLVDTNSIGTVIGSGSKVGGNLSITNNTASGSLAIQDITTGSGISVTGIASFTALNGSIFLANSSDAFGGLYGYTSFSKSFTASLTGPLVIQPGSQSGTASLAATGNISNVGGVAADTFTTLVLVSTAGTSVTLVNPLRVTAGLTVYAPGANVNLAGLSKSIDLNGVSPLITSSSNTAPTP